MAGLQPNPSAAALVDQLPPALLATIPAQTPPPGVIPDFVHPPWRVPEVFAVGVPLVFVATLALVIRLYMKIHVLKKWRIEDTTMTLGYLTSLAFFIIIAWGSVVGPIAKHGWDLYVSNAVSVGGFASIVCGTFLPLPALGLIKATLFLQYYHLFNPMKWMRYAISAGLLVNVLFYTAMTTTYIALMAQRPGETRVDDLLSYHFNSANDLFLPPGIVGALLDWYLLLLPVPAVLRLNMTPLKKFGVLSIFATGSLAAIASIVSLYNRSQLNKIIPDASWDVITVTTWVSVELFCGIIAACMPSIHLYWNRNPKLVKLSSKVKATMKTALGRSTGTGQSDDRRECGEVEPKHNPRFVTKENEISSTDSDGILITQAYSISHDAASHEGRDFPQDQSVLYLDRDVESGLRPPLTPQRVATRSNSPYRLYCEDRSRSATSALTPGNATET